VRAFLISYAAYSAYSIRLIAVQEYGRIIHGTFSCFSFSVYLSFFCESERERREREMCVLINSLSH
jgi:hypothetical protein